MKIYDESIALLKGQAEVHQKLINDLEIVKAQHEKSIAECLVRIDQYRNRIHGFQETVDSLYVLKAKGNA